jgi:cellulose synthase/poly-beta-1,6-N-acetylglucosamine synthase-like glycosyltransferase
MTPAILASALFSLWIVLLLWRDARRLRDAPVLPTPQDNGPDPQPFVSLIVPARNEERNIARCLDGLLAQDYPAYEVIVVDDGSSDATPRILAGYAQRHAGRLRVVQGRPLPPGWVGKCNACLHGSTFARGEGEWLLFLDADTVAAPTLIGALLADANARRLDALSVFPHNELGSWAERLILPVFFQFAWTVFPLAQAADPDGPPHAALANGQCFLFRTSVYRALGGHAVVKDKVLEDVEFAHVLRRAGYRLGLAFGMQHIRVRMYHTLGEVVDGLGKHAWNGRQTGGWRAYWGVARMMLTLLASPLLVAFWLWQWLARGDAAALLAALSAAVGCATALGFWRGVLRRLYGLHSGWAWLTPLGLLAYLLIILRGTLSMLLRRGVTWKGRSYS